MLGEEGYESTLREVFGVGVGERKLVELVFGRCACPLEIFDFEGGSVAAVAAKRVDLLRDKCIGAGVEHVQVRVSVGGGNVGHVFKMGAF